MQKTSTNKIYSEIEFNERRLLLLLSEDLLWFKKNLVNIKSHKNRKAFYKKKTEKYNQIYKTTQELANLSNKLTKTDSEFETSPYVFLEQEKLNSQNVKIKNDVKIKNLSKPKLFEVVSFTHFVDLFNNPKSRKYPKNKCVEIVKKKILDKNNNMPSSKFARDYYVKNQEDANLVINNLYIDSALYLKRDMELEMQASANKNKAKKQEKAIENHETLTRKHEKISNKKVEKNNTQPIKTAPIKKETKLTQKPETKTKKQYNIHTQTFEYVDEEEERTK